MTRNSERSVVTRVTFDPVDSIISYGAGLIGAGGFAGPFSLIIPISLADRRVTYTRNSVNIMIFLDTRETCSYNAAPDGDSYPAGHSGLVPMVRDNNWRRKDSTPQGECNHMRQPNSVLNVHHVSLPVVHVELDADREGDEELNPGEGVGEASRTNQKQGESE